MQINVSFSMLFGCSEALAGAPHFSSGLCRVAARGGFSRVPLTRARTAATSNATVSSSRDASSALFLRKVHSSLISVLCGLKKTSRAGKNE